MKVTRNFDKLKYRMKQVRRFLPILIGFFSLTIIFQNCVAPVRFQSLEVFEKSVLPNNGTAGNGQGYEGKPIGTYVRYLPNDKCLTNTDGVFAKLVLTATDNQLTEVSPNTCQPVSKNIPDSALSFSSNQHAAIGASDGLFVQEAWLKEQGGKVFEAWCKQKPSRDLIQRDLVISTSGSTAMATLWMDGIASSVSFQRELKNQILTYTSSELKITVNANRAPSLTNYLEGIWESSVGKYPAHLDFECRLGQSLDGVIWPSRPLLGFHFQQTTILKQSPAAVVVAENTGAPNSLARFDFTTEQLTTLSPLLATDGTVQLSNFVISSDEKFVFYKAKLQADNDVALISSKTDGSGSQVLNQTALTVNSSCNYQAYDARTATVFFTEPTASGASPEYCFLRANSANGGSYQRLVNESTLALDRTIQVQMNSDASELYYQKSPYGYGADEWFRYDAINRTTASFAPYRIYPQTVLWPTDKKTPYVFLGDGSSLATASLHIMDLATGQIQRIADPMSIIGGLSDDGNLIAILNSTPQSGSHFAVYNRLQNSLSVVAPNNLNGPSIYWWQFLPDSKHIVYVVKYNVQDDFQLFIADGDGKNERRLSLAGLKSVVPLNFNAMTMTILYRAINPDNTQSFYLVNTATGVNQKIQSPDVNRYNLSSAGFFAATVQQMNDRAFFIYDIDGDSVFELYVLYFDGRGLQQLSDRYVDYGSVINFKVLSPTHVVFQTMKGPVNTLFSWREP